MREVRIPLQLAVFGSLLVLTTATLGLSFQPLGAFHTPVAIAIAVAKSALIVLFFMHLAEQRPVNALVLLVSLLLLVVFAGLTAADVATRHVGPNAPTDAPLAAPTSYTPQRIAAPASYAIP